MYSDYKELAVWNKSMQLAERIYHGVKNFPKAEMFELSSQMRRAAVSIPSNIAEGQARKSDREFLRFLSIAQGSRAELETQILLSNRLGYLTDEQVSVLIAQTSEIGKMLTSLSNSIKQS